MSTPLEEETTGSTEKPKRPMNAYFHFAENRPIIKGSGFWWEIISEVAGSDGYIFQDSICWGGKGW